MPFALKTGAMCATDGSPGAPEPFAIAARTPERPATATVEHLDLVMRATRAQFVAACPFPFLVGGAAMVPPAGPRSTSVLAQLPPKRPTPPGRAVPRLFAVRKVQEAFPSMITVGRTNNHDIVLADVAISKFHAYFRTRDGRLEVADAGSRNGTWVGLRRLDPKGTGLALTSGDVIRFGPIEFAFLDAGACWDRLRVRPDR